MAYWAFHRNQDSLSSCLAFQEPGNYTQSESLTWTGSVQPEWRRSGRLSKTSLFPPMRPGDSKAVTNSRLGLVFIIATTKGLDHTMMGANLGSQWQRLDPHQSVSVPYYIWNRRDEFWPGVFQWLRFVDLVCCWSIQSFQEEVEIISDYILLVKQSDYVFLYRLYSDYIFLYSA